MVDTVREVLMVRLCNALTYIRLCHKELGCLFRVTCISWHGDTSDVQVNQGIIGKCATNGEYYRMPLKFLQ